MANIVARAFGAGQKVCRKRRRPPSSGRGRQQPPLWRTGRHWGAESPFNWRVTLLRAFVEACAACEAGPANSIVPAAITSMLSRPPLSATAAMAEVSHAPAPLRVFTGRLGASSAGGGGLAGRGREKILPGLSEGGAGPNGTQGETFVACSRGSLMGSVQLYARELASHRWSDLAATNEVSEFIPPCWCNVS